MEIWASHPKMTSKNCTAGTATGNLPILVSHFLNTLNPSHIRSLSRKSTLKNGSFLMTHTIIDRSDDRSWMRRSIQPLFVHIKCSGRTHSPTRRKSGKETSTVWLQGLDVKIILFWDSELRKAFRNLLQRGYATNVDPGSEACKAYVPA